MVDLEGLTQDGYTHLVIPAPYLWWLEHYPELSEYLNPRAVFSDPAVGALFALTDAQDAPDEVTSPSGNALPAAEQSPAPSAANNKGVKRPWMEILRGRNRQ